MGPSPSCFPFNLAVTTGGQSTNDGHPNPAPLTPGWHLADSAAPGAQDGQPAPGTYNPRLQQEAAPAHVKTR
ncbi:hypothetical protein AQPW35_04780 [Rubrivivax pictus]|uniref:Uncharacterized protein n=1 Tax=Pseudaquabacterium pictum TaxID=2315236 RepID=A0A480ALW8_9BURK|nr:hypothetical protein AQPW35_04780 [Rubrivivax pictus]